LAPWRSGALAGVLFALTAASAQPVPGGFNELLARAAAAGTNGAMTTALDLFSQAEALSVSNAPSLCVLTRQYCDLMYAPGAATWKPELARRALASALQAEQADPNNPTAHLCVAVTYAKNFDSAPLRTKVVYSRLIKQEAERAAALDPKQDVAYYLLGRWHHGVANMDPFSRAIVKIVYGGLPRASNAEAIRCFQTAIALHPERIVHHSGLGQVYADMGQSRLARAEWEKCRDLKPLDHDDEDARNDALLHLANAARKDSR
jgi:tetratricopeptide (TPR) repeat protein